MMTKIIRDITKVKLTNESNREEGLSCARRVVVQKSQKAILDVTKESKEFDTIKKNEQQTLP